MKLRPVIAWLTCCALLAACTSLPQRAANLEEGDRVDDQILVMLRAAAPHFRPDAQYLSGYAPNATNVARRSLGVRVAHRYGLDLVDAWPMAALGVDCFVMQVPDAERKAALIDALGRDPDVESVQPMHEFHVLAHNDPLYPLQPAATAWHLADLHRIATGRGVRVAAIDTGVELSHPDLRDRIELYRDFTGATRDAAMHGTAVAGIIAARADDDIGIAGIAPASKLDMLRACRERGDVRATCTTFALARALQFALERDINVLNLSLGGPPDRLLARLLDVALARHVVIVAAADEDVPGGAFPASHPGVLAVGARPARNLPPGAVLAPGRDVPASLPGHRWGLVSGTSFAAAQVSGAVALLLERAPKLDTAAIRSALQPSGNAQASVATWIDACSALARTSNACVCECADAHDSTAGYAR